MAHGRQLWDALWSMDSLVARRALGPEAPLTCCYEFLQVGSIMAAAPFYHFTLPLKSGDNSYGRLNRHGHHRFKCLNFWPIGSRSSTIRRYGLVGGSASLWGALVYTHRYTQCVSQFTSCCLSSCLQYNVCMHSMTLHGDNGLNLWNWMLSFNKSCCGHGGLFTATDTFFVLSLLWKRQKSNGFSQLMDDMPGSRGPSASSS